MAAGNHLRRVVWKSRCPYARWPSDGNAGLPADLVAGAEKEAVTMRTDQGTTAYRPDVQVREPWALKEPAAVVLDLQPLIDQCHERGRYHLLNYRAELEPPLSSEEAAWVDEILRPRALR